MSIVVKDVYKIFGPHPQQALQRLQSGASRDELLRSGHTPAVVNASFEIQDGEIFVIMGLSGSGKSTVIRTLNRLIEPTSGTIEVNGVDLGALEPKDLRTLRAKQMSMVFQHFALLPHRTVRDNAAFGLEVQKYSKAERLERAETALVQAGLSGWGDATPDELSGGMRQRVGLARALATEAPILLMDEAFSALDPLIKREMQDQLVELQSQLGHTIVFITHDLNEAMRLGDRIAVMRDGEIVQIGTAEEILQEPADDYVASFVQDVDRSRVLTAEGVMDRPVATISSYQGPAAAMRRMRELQVSALFVLGPQRKLVGTIDDDGVARLLREQAHTLDDALNTEDLATVSPGDYLADLLLPSAENALPLAVVDDNGVLRGVILRVTLLEALSRENSGTNGDAESPVLDNGNDAASQVPVQADDTDRELTPDV